MPHDSGASSQPAEPRRHQAPLSGNWLDHFREVFPELSDVDYTDDSLMSAAWSDVRDILRAAYESKPPNDDDMCRVYGFAAWCVENLDEWLMTQVFVSFYEMLPDPKFPAIRADVGRWIEPDLFYCPAMVHFMTYGLYGSEEAYATFREEYEQRRRIIAKDASRRKSRAARKA